MTFRADTSSLISGKHVASLYDSFGILGADVSSASGDVLAAMIYASLSLPADNAKQYRFQVTSLPAVGTLDLNEDTTLVYTPGADGTYYLVGDLWEYNPAGPSVSNLGALTVTFNVGVITFEAAVAVSSAVVGALTTNVLLAASVVGSATTTGALTTAIQLTATPSAAGTVTGVLTTAIPLLAATSVTATAAADLTAPGQSLTVSANVTATASGALTTAIQLRAAVTTSATATGELASNAAALASAVSASATATGQLTTGIALSAAASSTALCAASLTTSIQLAASVGAECSASLSLIVTVALFADAIITAAAQGTLRTFAAPPSTGGDPMIVGAEATSMTVPPEVTAMVVRAEN